MADSEGQPDSGIGRKPSGSEGSTASRMGPIRTSEDFVNVMSALMSDVLGDRVTVAKANAATKAGSAILRVVELQHRYAGKDEKNESLPLLISGKAV